jgi:hypothetical protein
VPRASAPDADTLLGMTTRPRSVPRPRRPHPAVACRDALLEVLAKVTMLVHKGQHDQALAEACGVLAAHGRLDLLLVAGSDLYHEVTEVPR